MINTPSITYNHGIIDLLRRRKEHTNVLIIGNNPIELTNIYNNLNEYRKKNYIADVCFNVSDSISRMLKNKPDCILLDDNILLDQVDLFIKKLKSTTSLKSIPIVLLKSTNFNLSIGNDVQDFLLKGNMTMDILSSAIERNCSFIKKLVKK